MEKTHDLFYCFYKEYFFTHEPLLVAATVPLIILADRMLLFDSLQTVIGNGLRGRRDVWAPTALYFFSYIIVMIPLGYFLAFPEGRGAAGLFSGPCLLPMPSSCADIVTQGCVELAR